MDLEETQKRRELFYEIFTYDLWQVNEILFLWFFDMPKYSFRA